MEVSWFVFSVSATLLFGLAMALYKVPSFKGQSRQVTAFWAMVIPFLLSLIFFSGYLNLSSFWMICFAMVWGVSFSLLVMLQMYALKHVDTGSLFPVTSISGLVITVLLGIILFDRSISFLQFAGIVLVVVLVYLYTHKKKKLSCSKGVLFVGVGIVFLSVFNKIIHKIVVSNFDIHAYQIYQYFFAMLFSFLILLYVHGKDFRDYFSKTSFVSGGLIGLFSFFGAYLFLVALREGPFSLVMTVHALYIFVTALVGVILFEEKMGCKKVVLLLLSIVALILIKLG